MTTATPSSRLSQEVDTYNRHKADLLRTAEGKYVIIKEDEIFGVFETESEAYGKAIRHYGIVPLLMRRSQQEEEMLYLGGSAFQVITGLDVDEAQEH